MWNNQKGTSQDLFSKRASQGPLRVMAVLAPRLWKALVILALPFIIVCANFFEAMEHSGALGAVIADMLMPVTIIGYIVLTITLYNREV